MQLTPGQIEMFALLGEELPFCMSTDQCLAERIKVARKNLVIIAGVDFEYDAAKWHEHLRQTNAGGYRWTNKHLGMLKLMAKAISDPEWCAAVDQLRKMDQDSADESPLSGSES